ncbi:MAG TPA: class I SAM-dependent methyltransferase [Bryobacteraceae bacterium]|nr:class I SAM-dependent methyltransferase [Bryobacteraceae bacterium]
MSSQHIQITDDLIGYVRAISPPEPEYLVRLRTETAKDPLARMQITPEQGLLLGILVRLLNARKTLEVGVFTGYSALSVARALPPDGRVIACDVSEQWTSIARRYWREAGLADKIDLRLRPALETLESLLAAGEAGTFDFAFLDADKTGYDAYYERALRLLRKGGLIAIDNVLWHGLVIDAAAQDEDTVALRTLNEKISRDPRVDVCVLPISDGLTLAVKR